MADFSFDIMSKIDDQEVVNAVDQAMREVTTRYDLKGTDSTIDFRQQEHRLILDAPDDYKIKAIYDILVQKIINRNISPKALSPGQVEPAGGARVKQTVTLQQGIEQDSAKQIVKDIKGKAFKVQVQIQGDQLRVSGKKKDELQAVMQFVKSQDYPMHISFGNYR